jgi:hypothetical protein
MKSKKQRDTDDRAKMRRNGLVTVAIRIPKGKACAAKAMAEQWRIAHYKRLEKSNGQP